MGSQRPVEFSYRRLQVTVSCRQQPAAPSTDRPLPRIAEIRTIPDDLCRHVLSITEAAQCNERLDLVSLAANNSAIRLEVAASAKGLEVFVGRNRISRSELYRAQDGQRAVAVRVIPYGDRDRERLLPRGSRGIVFASVAVKHRTDIQR